MSAITACLNSSRSPDTPPWSRGPAGDSEGDRAPPGEAGASVVLADIDEDAAGIAADELAKAGMTAIAARMDAASGSDIAAVADLAERELGGLDIWVNNAGIVSNYTLLFDLPDEEWDRVIDINLRGAFFGAREAARRMKAGGRGGVIVNVASLARLRGIAPGQVAYVSSKHGVVGLTQQDGDRTGPPWHPGSRHCAGRLPDGKDAVHAGRRSRCWAGRHPRHHGQQAGTARRWPMTSPAPSCSAHRICRCS